MPTNKEHFDLQHAIVGVVVLEPKPKLKMLFTTKRWIVIPVFLHEGEHFEGCDDPDCLGKPVHGEPIATGYFRDRTLTRGSRALAQLLIGRVQKLYSEGLGG